MSGDLGRWPAFKRWLVRGSNPAASDRAVVHAGLVAAVTAAGVCLLAGLSVTSVGLPVGNGVVLAVGVSLLGATGLAALGAFRGAGVGPTLVVVLAPLLVGLAAVAVVTAAGLATLSGSVRDVIRGVLVGYGLTAWLLAYVSGTAARVAAGVGD